MDTLKTERISTELEGFDQLSSTEELAQSKYRFTKKDAQTQAFFVIEFEVKNNRLGWFECEVFDHPSQRSMLSVLKSKGFRSSEQFLKGDFITTVFDNGKYIVEQKYQVIDNPKGKGQIPNYKYYCYEKMGPFDTMNGVFEATKSVNGKSYVAERKTVKNGVLNGEYFYYYPNGNVQRKEQYQNGRLSGLACDYDSTGRLIHSCTYSWNWRYGMEKWYDNNGKVQRSVQWQRDKKSGTEKVTLSGETILQVTYKNSVANGPAIFPFNNYPFSTMISDTLNSLPIGIEKVTLKNGLKDGPFVALSLPNKDTLATGFYVNNQPDSVWRFYHNGVLGLERKYIDSIPSIVSTWNVTTGEHKGQSAKIEIQNRATNSTYVAQRFEPQVKGNNVVWVEHFYEARDSSGVLVGSFRDEWPGKSITKGRYLNGKKHGVWLTSYWFANDKWGSEIEFDNGVLNGSYSIRDTNQTVIGWYVNGQKDSTWITFSPETKQTERYKNGKLQGLSEMEYHGTAQRLWYEDNCLTNYSERAENGDSIQVDLLARSTELVACKWQEWKNDTIYTLKNYSFPISIIQDTVNPLFDVIQRIQNRQDSSVNVYVVDYELKTPSYELSGTRQNIGFGHTVTIHHLHSNVYEAITNNANATPRSYFTTNKKVYSGVFYSTYTNEKIRVRKGWRQGWSEVYSQDGRLVQRVKYDKGIQTKATNKPAMVHWEQFLFWK